MFLFNGDRLVFQALHLLDQFLVLLIHRVEQSVDLKYIHSEGAHVFVEPGQQLEGGLRVLVRQVLVLLDDLGHDLRRQSDGVEVDEVFLVGGQVLGELGLGQVDLPVHQLVGDQAKHPLLVVPILILRHALGSFGDVVLLRELLLE